MSAPAVSVIIPVFNGEKYLAQAIESIIQQNYTPLEVIVIDDGSTDESGAIARSFPGVRCIQRKHEGLAHAWNAGIAAATGDLISFLAADDIWSPDKLSVQVGYMQKHPEVDYTVAHMKCFLEPGCPHPPGFRREQLGVKMIYRVPETLMARGSVFDVVGLFDTNLTTAQELDWFARAQERGLTIAILPEVLLLRRIHDQNFTFTAPAKENNANILRLLHNSIRRQRGGTPSS